MNRLNTTLRSQIGYQYLPENTGSTQRTLLNFPNPFLEGGCMSGSCGSGLSLSGSGLSLSGGGKCGEYCKCSQCGEGVLSAIKHAYTKGKNIVSNVKNAYVSETSQRLRNMLPNADETGAQGFSGEMHAILKLPNGNFGTANYMGPGTQVIKRIKRGDRPRTASDKVAQAHDIRYSLTNNQSDIQKADKMMINKLQDILRKREDNALNVNMGLRPIQAKYYAEKTGLISPGTFAKYGTANDPADRALLTSKLSELEQEGYGMLPGEMLKKKLLKTYKNVGGDDTLKNMSEMIIKHALPIMIKKLGGSGLKLAGQGQSKMSQALYMAMLKKQNNGASRNQDDVLGTEGMRGRGITEAMTKIKPYAVTAGKFLLPIIMKEVEKRIRDKYLSGSGLNRSKQIINKHVANAMIHYIKNDKNIKNMYGTGFWKDFGKGFLKGFTETMKIGLPIVKMLV